MKHSNASVTYEWEDEEGGRSLTFEIEGYVSPYIPAQTYGPPENCYPAEGGCLEDWEFHLIDGTIYDEDGNVLKEFKDFTDLDRRKAVEDFDTHFAANLFERIQDDMLEDAQARAEDYYDD